jgi:hypothetical protein
MRSEDEFLFWQRRLMIAGCAGILAYGIFVEPKYLIMLPILLLSSVVALRGIARDRKRP